MKIGRFSFRRVRAWVLRVSAAVVGVPCREVPDRLTEPDRHDRHDPEGHDGVDGVAEASGQGWLDAIGTDDTLHDAVGYEEKYNEDEDVLHDTPFSNGLHGVCIILL